MRVLLVATNRYDRVNNRMNAQPMPIGLAYIAGHLDHERHQVKVVDLMFADDYLGEIEQTVREFQPHVVGISLRNLSNHSYMDTQWALPITKSVIDRIREHSSATIIVGGPAFSLLPKQCFKYLQPDSALRVTRVRPSRRCANASRLANGPSTTCRVSSTPGMETSS